MGAPRLRPLPQRHNPPPPPPPPPPRRAVNEAFSHVFVNPSDIGGRYSALTLFGIVPAAIIGVPLPALLDGARQMVEACRTKSARGNPGVALGAFIGARSEE